MVQLLHCKIGNKFIFGRKLKKTKQLMSRNYIMENFKINSNIFHGNASNNFEFMGTSGHKSLFNKLTCFPQNQNYCQNRFKMQIGKKISSLP